MKKQQKKDSRSKNNETFRALANFSQIGITMAAAVLIGVFIGKYLDDLFNTKPCLLLIFSLLGAGAALRSLFQVPDKKK